MMGTEVDEKIERRIRENVRFYASLGGDSISERIRMLDREWDVDRAVAAGLAGAGLFGLVMGLLDGKLWRLLTWLSLPMLFLHGTRRWSPPSDFLRRRGIRSRAEIDEEKFALKALRGDFQSVAPPSREEAENLARVSSRAVEAAKA